MAWTQPTLPTVTAVTVPFKVLCKATIDPGAAIFINASDHGAGLAEADNAKPCNAFAITGGVDGDTIDAALSVIIRSRPTRSGDQYSGVAICSDAEVGSPIYLSETAGEVSLSPSASIAQCVGYIIDKYTALLVPTGYLTSDNLSLSGTLSVTGATTLGSTLGVTGNVAVNTDKFQITASNGNTAIAGTLGVTGASTFAGGVIVGTGTGIKQTVKAHTASEAIATSGFVALNNAAAKIEMTLANPTGGELLIISQIDSDTKGHTVTSAGATFDGSHTVATFDAKDETLVLFAISATRWVIVENIGSVVLS